MARRKVDLVELKGKGGAEGYDFVVGLYDYHLRLEGGVWILDQFQLQVQDADQAHVRTVEVESLADGVHYALEEPLA